MFGNLQWTKKDSVDLQIKEIFDSAKNDIKVKNAVEDSDEQNAKIETVRAISDAINITITTGREIYMAYNDETKNKLGQKFNLWLNDIIFQSIYVAPK